MEDNYPTTQLKRTRALEGCMVYSVIHNGGYYGTDVGIYEDAVFYCWKYVDADGLKEAINSGWLVPQIPNGEKFSIGYLGHWTIKNANWKYDKDSYFDFLMSVVRKMNPAMQNIFNTPDGDSKLIGNSNYAAISYSSEEMVRKDAATPSYKNVKGRRQHYFYKVADTYHLVGLDIYSDSIILIAGGPTHLTCDLKQIKALVVEGVLVCELPVNAMVSMKDFGTFEVQETLSSANINSQILEIDDIIAALNNKPTTSDICSTLYREYIANPSPALKEKLKEAFDRIPDHLQDRILRDMSGGNWPLWSIVYFDDEDN